MHEYSIVGALIEQIEQIAKDNGAIEVDKVVIKIGSMSGVEPDLLKTAFDTFKEKTVCDSAELVMDIEAIIIKCSSCSDDFTVQTISYRCPKCGGSEISIDGSDEMLLMSLEAK